VAVCAKAIGETTPRVHMGRSPRSDVARYFFHLCDGRDALIDPEGRELVEAAMIAGAALKEARMMISQDALGGRITLHQFIEVRDRGGKLVHNLLFRDAVTISP
jgi:hypothetical protein